MSSVFHYDYFALGDISPQRWHDDFFWPTPRETTTQITLDVFAEQQRLVNALGWTFEGDCLLIGIGIAMQYCVVLNHYLTVRRLLDMGLEIRHSDKLVVVPKLIQAGSPLTFPALRLDFPKENMAARKMRNFLRSAAYNRGKRPRFWEHFFPGRAVQAFSAENVLNRTFTRSLPQWARITSLSEWAPETAPSLPAGADAVFQETAAELALFAARYSEKRLAMPWPSSLTEAMRDFGLSSLRNIGRVYAGLLKKARRVKPRHLLTFTAGNQLIRAVSLAARNAGAKVTGFPHGYYICHYQSPRQAFHELATVDEFMAYSPGSLPLFKRNLAMNRPPRDNPVVIRHENTPFFRDRWDQWKDRPLPDRVKTVMVLELSLIPEWAGYHCTENLVTYHFYYTLCKTLSQAGYHVLFKKRPKGLGWEGVDILSGIPNVEPVYEHFEAPGVLDRADAVVVQYAMSSTLYWSMCSNKKVIYVDAGWEPWFPDVYALMAKRCDILHVQYDERNRPSFDKRELLDIMARKPGRPNIEFLEKYLFPEGPAGAR